MRSRRHPLRFVRERLLPAPERRAAQAERRAEAAIRLQRDNVDTTARRAAALEAERHRHAHGLPTRR